MKLIVDMPEGIYRCALKDNMYVSKPLSNAIKNGVPIDTIIEKMKKDIKPIDKPIIENFIKALKEYEL